MCIWTIYITLGDAELQSMLSGGLRLSQICVEGGLGIGKYVGNEKNRAKTGFIDIVQNVKKGE
jgi:hypothetical protein